MVNRPLTGLTGAPGHRPAVTISPAVKSMIWVIVEAAALCAQSEKPSEKPEQAAEQNGAGERNDTHGHPHRITFP